MNESTYRPPTQVGLPTWRAPLDDGAYFLLTLTGDRHELRLEYFKPGQPVPAVQLMGAGSLTPKMVRHFAEQVELQQRGRYTAALEFAVMGQEQWQEAREAMVQDAAAAEGAPRYSLIDDEAIQHVPPPEWLVQGLLPADALATMLGPPEAGKTFVSLHLAFCMGTGRDFGGYKVKQGESLIVAGEGFHGFGVRTTAWKAKYGVTGYAGVRFLNEPIDLLDASTVDQLLRVVDPLLVKPQLIVLDTWARNYSGDENSAADVGNAIRAMDRIRRETGATVLAVHHVRLDGERERGSTSLRGAMEAMLRITRSDTEIAVSCEKMKEAEHFKRVDFALAPHGPSAVLMTPMNGIGVNAELSDRQWETLKSLHARFGVDPAAAKEWRFASGVPESTFFGVASVLKRKGLVRQTGSGRSAKYRLTEQGKSVVTLRLQSDSNETPAENSITPLQSPSLEGMEGWSQGPNHESTDEPTPVPVVLTPAGIAAVQVKPDW